MDLSKKDHRWDSGSGELAGRAAPGSARESESVRRAVRMFQAGVEREKSFRLLFETFRPTVHGFFLRRLASPEAARDLTQETFIKVYKGLRGYRGDAPFGAWLFRIARNVLHDRGSGSAAARLRAREVGIEAVEMELAKRQAEGAQDATGSETALQSVLEDEERRILRRAIDKLPPQRRRCVILWAYHELTYEQIAVAMRLSIGTIKAHLAQARKQLGRLVRDSALHQER